MQEDAIAEMEELINTIDDHLAKRHQSGFSVGKLLMLRGLCEEELDMLLIENGEVE